MTQAIGLVGGTGAEGRGLAVRLGAVGRDILIGSRSATRAAMVPVDYRENMRLAEKLGSLVCAM